MCLDEKKTFKKFRFYLNFVLLVQEFLDLTFLGWNEIKKKFILYVLFSMGQI